MYEDQQPDENRGIGRDYIVCKDKEHPVLRLLHGTRRDDFKVTKIGTDSIFVKMNTYDAALVAKVETGGKITGEYRSLVPCFRGNALPFSAEYGKRYRFVEKGKEQRTKYNLSGKWDLQVFSKAKIPDPYKLTFLKEGCKKLDFTLPDLDGKKVFQDYVAKWNKDLDELIAEPTPAGISAASAGTTKSSK